MHTLLFVFGVVLVLSVVIVTVSNLYYGGGFCSIFGHNWDLEPPWSGKELRYNPSCQRCGHEPDDISIVGFHEGGHRV